MKLLVSSSTRGSFHPQQNVAQAQQFVAAVPNLTTWCEFHFGRVACLAFVVSCGWVGEAVKPNSVFLCVRPPAAPLAGSSGGASCGPSGGASRGEELALFACQCSRLKSDGWLARHTQLTKPAVHYPAAPGEDTVLSLSLIHI